MAGRVRNALGRIKKLNISESVRKIPMEKAGRHIPFGFILTLIFITALMLIAIDSSVKVNECVIEISSLKQEIKSLETEKKAYELLLDKKNDLVYFDEYASYSLGMIKGDYVTVSALEERGEDKIEAYDGYYTEGSFFSRLMNAIARKFTESWNNLLR